MAPSQQQLSHPFFDWLSVSNTPAEAQAQLAKGLAVENLERLTPSPEWLLYHANFLTDSLKLTAVVGSSFSFEIHDKDFNYLLLGHEGLSLIHQGGEMCSLHANRGVILPRGPWKLMVEESSSFTALGFAPLKLLATARDMAPSGWTPPVRQESPLLSLISLPRKDDDVSSDLLQATKAMIPIFRTIAPLGHSFLNSFCLVEQMYKLLAFLVFKSLNDDPSLQSKEANQTDPNLDRILDYINLNLDKSLSVDLLIKQAKCSSRRLYNCFHERLGCTPLQWIRRERMSLALSKLQSSLPGACSVERIALSCGYRSIGRFYIDFKRTYGCTPYEILKRDVEL